MTLSRSTLPPFPGELGNRLGKFERIIAREGALHGRAEFESRTALQLLPTLLSHLELQGSNFLTSPTNIPFPLGP